MSQDVSRRYLKRRARVFDVISEVIGWPETLKLGIIGFLSLSGERYSMHRDAIFPRKFKKIDFVKICLMGG